jgi:hypothetical protein
MFTFKKLALIGVVGLTAFAMSCSDDDDPPPPDETPLKKASLVLSGGGTSYGDVDAATGYKSDALAANAAKIDLIAFAGSTVTPSNDTIYAPGAVGGAAGDIFEALGQGIYDILMLPLPDEAISIIEGLETVDNYETNKAALDAFKGDQSKYKDVSGITTNKKQSFLLFTSEDDIVAVVLDSVSTTSPTKAKLNITYMPKK